jgi:hypothetical protein
VTTFDYTRDYPSQISLGQDVPEPAPLQGPAGYQSTQQIKQDAANYLETGKLPQVSRGNSPVAKQQAAYVAAIKNYAGALAASRGYDVAELAHKWRTNPYAMRWILGVQGRSATGMGTAMRHLDSLEQAYTALNNGNIQLFNEIKARFGIATGVAAPVAVNAMRQIVGTEIIKGLGAQGGGSEKERAEAAAAYSVALGPEQFAVTKSSVQDLLAGQLEGRLGEAKNAGVTEEEFKRQVGSREYQHLMGLAAKRQAAPQQTAQPSGAPSGSKPIPTDKDRAFARSGKPGAREQFMSRFGVEP